MEGLRLERVDTEEALVEAVTSGQYVAGVALQDDLLARFTEGRKPRISLYFTSDAPAEIRGAIEVLIQELAYVQVGQPLSLEISEEILGPDRVGIQLPPRDRLRPLFAVVLIMTETFFLATLISDEIERRTIRALLVTPMSVKDLVVAKGIVGISLAVGQAAFFMAVVGGMNVQPLVILVALLLGGVMVTAVGFLIASVAKDMMSVMGWGVLALVPMILPSFTFLFPGAMSGWVKAIPSYYLVDTVHLAANFGSG